MSLTLGTSIDQSPAGRTIPVTSTSSTTLTTSSSSTTSVSASTSSSSSSSTTSNSTTTPTAQVRTTAQSLSDSSSTTSWPVSSTLSRSSPSQSSVSQTSTTTSTSAAVATAASSPDPTITLNPLPSTRQHGTLIVAESTSLATVSTYELPFTSQTPNTQSFQNLTPTTTSAPGPTSTSVTELPDRAVHRLIIDLGECAEFTSPRLMLERGDLGDLVAIGKGRFAIELKSELSTGIFGVVLSLKDNGVRCGSGASAACTAVELSFGLTSGVSAHVLMAGDYSIDMYPFSMWLEDGVTWGAQLVNSPEQTYHCWGWSQEECPYAFSNSGDASWTASSDNPTGVVYVGFCPSDGPDWSKIPPNPNPQSFEPGGEGTYIELPTQTVLSTSTFLTAITPTKLSVPITSEPPCDLPVMSCISPNTYISEDVTSTIWSEFITAPGPSTILFSTAIVIHTTSTVPETTTFPRNPTTSFLSRPTPTVTSWLVESTDFENSFTQSEWTFSTLTGPRTRRRPTGTASSRSGTPISTPPPTVVPTYSDITNSLGSVVSTLSYDVPVSATVSPAPTITSAPNSQYVITSWTTWMTVNGSTVPAIAGEVGILSTIPITYMLEPSTTIPVAEISSRSVESIRTSSPSPTIAASSDSDQTQQNQGGKIAGAVVGTLVGLVLGSLLLWYIFYRRRRRQRLDHFARGDPAWLAPRYENGSGGGSRLLVDLDEEPRMRNSYVEPWVAPGPVAQSSSRGKASQREMESVSGGHGVSIAAGPSREVESSSNEGGSSWFQPESSDNHHVPVAAVTRPGKTVARNEPTRRPDLVSQRPVPSHYQTPSLANPSLSLLPTPFQNEPPSPLTPPSPPSRAALMPGRASPPPRPGPSQRRYVNDEEQVRDNTIPPLYNEAWNTGR
ncbi:unnamed protein product [Rhizoctonia solani]|uniref:Transmembrane protein n=1 Tax=Rhizoctonia solani TaxID=456999 RepID=A0A8H3DEF9_9AGAM|nr:unnamed protein product [Rhizoctonia solani]